MSATNTLGVVLEDCLFDGNEATVFRGGGVEIVGASGETMVAGCTFRRNKIDGVGGGMYVDAESLTVVASLLERNIAVDVGGGLLLEVGEGRVCESTFRDNWAGIGGGMSLSAEVGSIVDCLFEGNWSDDGLGGGLHMSGNALTIQRCAFTDNSARRGGGAYNYGNTLVTQSTFASNAAVEGGGVFDGATLAAVDSLFERNWAFTGGGVLAGNGPSQTTLTRCSFRRNSAAIGAGASVVDSDRHLLGQSCLFCGNEASAYGGGVAAGPGALTLDNCTLVRNSAHGLGGGVIVGAMTTLSSSILWGNVTDPHGGAYADELAQIEGIHLATIAHTCVQGWTGLYGDGTNIGDDPLFVGPLGPDGQAGTEDDNLRLSLGSPAINAGAPFGDPSPSVPGASYFADLDGNPRMLCGIVDMGAYEYGLVADIDCNDMVNLLDFAHWAGCMTGPGRDRDLGTCGAFDIFPDGTVDLHDFAGFQRIRTSMGP